MKMLVGLIVIDVEIDRKEHNRSRYLMVLMEFEKKKKIRWMRVSIFLCIKIYWVDLNFEFRKPK